jgi:membrane associated rhomboid family serine protease
MEDNYRKKMVLGQDGNALVQLVIINAVLFAILKFIYVISNRLNSLNRWPIISAMSCPGLPSGQPGQIVKPPLDRPDLYVLPTSTVFRFIGNMFWLWGFGYILQDLTGNRKLIPIYLYGGIAGAALLSLCFAYSPNCRIELPCPADGGQCLGHRRRRRRRPP